MFTYIHIKRTLAQLSIGLIFVFLGQVACSNALPVIDLCEPKRVKLQMLGTRGPELWDESASVSYLVWLDDRARIMIDAGPGSSQNFEASGASFEDLDAILFTHFHVDHSADFLSYAKGGFFSERIHNLTIVGPSGRGAFISAKAFLDRSIGNKGLYPYLSDFINPEDKSEYKIKAKTLEWSDDNPEVIQAYVTPNHDMTVSAVATRHGPVPSFAYRVEVAGCSIVFTGDMNGSLGKVPKLAKNAHILVAHNAIPESQMGIAARLHMKPSYIGEMAKQAGVKKLLLTHLMRRSASAQTKKETLSIIKKTFKGKVIFSEDLDVYILE